MSDRDDTPGDPRSEAHRLQDELQETTDDRSGLPEVPALAISEVVPCLVVLGDTPLSKHIRDNLTRFGEDATDQFEFQLKLEYNPFTYPKIIVTILRNVDVSGDIVRTLWVGRMEFYFQSMSKGSCGRMSKDAATAALNTYFGLEKGTVEAPYGCICLSFCVSRVLFYCKRSLAKSPKFRQQLDQIQHFVDSVSDEYPGEVTIFASDDAPSDPDPENSHNGTAIVHPDSRYTPESTTLNPFIAIVQLMLEQADYLKVWFSASPRVEVLNAETILQVGKEYYVAGGQTITRPEVDPIPACIKFSDLRQYKIAQAYGSVDDMPREQSLADKTMQKVFKCHLIAFSQNPDDSGNPSAVAIAIPYSKDSHSLPRRGADCKIRIIGLKRNKNRPYELNVPEHLPSFLASLMYGALEKDESPEGFVGCYKCIKEKTSEEKYQEIEEQLKEMYREFQTSKSHFDPDAVEDFVSQHSEHLCFPEVQDPDGEEDNHGEWDARATDISLPFLEDGFRCFIANIPMEPVLEAYGGEPRRANFGLELPGKGDSYSVYIQKMLAPEKSKRCQIQTTPLDKTLRQEIQAHAELQDPASVPRGSPPVSEIASKMYKWLPSLDHPAEKSPDLVSHFDLFPGMKRAVDGTAPRYLQDMYDDFDKSKKKTYAEHMTKIPFRLAAIPGTPACGKTRFAIFYALMHLAEEVTAESQPRKVLIVAPHNQALDDYEASFLRLLEKYGAPKDRYPRMERVHSIPSEVQAAVRSVSGEAKRE
ncbi:hypothetical protein F4774DRAFT_91493 [Daldinia eschscholtzii]|nr:hypothetical protein F4774DRAFT_91493 [Daldinia eschscholtzii]